MSRMKKWIYLTGIVGGVFLFLNFVFSGLTSSKKQQNSPAISQQQNDNVNVNGLRDPRELVQHRELSRAERVIENYESTASYITERTRGFHEEFEARRAAHAAYMGAHGY